MLYCVVALLVWMIVAVLIVYILELLLGHLGAPPIVSTLLRCLAGLLLLLFVLSCTGLLPALGMRPLP